MTLSPGTMLGHFEIIAKLGAGGMGEVYRARDRRLDRDVAIKVLPEAMARDATALGRFQREIKVVANLSHPNILTMFDIGTHEDVTFAVMELLEGQTLRQRIKQSVLDLPEVLSIASAVADGLSAAHAKGIVHRDIKPDNIFLTANGTVKILDFGLARQDQPRDEFTTVTGPPTIATQPGVLMGTITYMSPEQVRGQQADLRSDVFAFGCVLFEMLTGRRPFERATSADTMSAILNEAPPTLSASGKNRPMDLDRLVLRCLEKMPEDRFASARELAGLLKQMSVQAAAGAATQSEFDTAAYQSGTRPARGTGPSVAVLPFVNMSSDPENEFFSDGLAEELISSLSKVEGLHVASRTSSFAFKGKNENIRKIGEELKVKTVLEGSVRKSGNRLRISAQLVNVSDGFQLWSETFNRQMEDIFAIQDEIAQSIAKALKGILTEKDREAIGKAATDDVRAYEYYLRGRQFFHQFRHKGFEFARQMFAKAIEIDPNYARAHAGLADCYSFLFLNWEPRPEHLAQAEAATQKALELDPNSAEAHVSRGFALSLLKNYAEARSQFETAIQLDPNLYEAYFFFARACMAEGKREEAATLYEKALKVRPDAYQPACLRASVYFGLGRKEEALAACRHGMQVVQKHLDLHPDDARALYLGAILLSRTGETSKALEWADRAVAIDPEETMTLYNVACLYSVLGQADRALDCLDNAVKLGYSNWRWMENDSDFDTIRSDPRYASMMQHLKETYP